MNKLIDTFSSIERAAMANARAVYMAQLKERNANKKQVKTSPCGFYKGSEIVTNNDGSITYWQWK